MKIAVIGERKNFEEFKSKFGEDHEYTFMSDIDSAEYLKTQDVIFHFTIDENQDHMQWIMELMKLPVFLNTVKITLTELCFTFGKPETPVFGFNGLPGFFDRDQMEVSVLDSAEQPEEILSTLQADFLLCDDRVGMVTPRVIMMIINEAFYTVQEGTASREDIDMGMKLGTNYPFGPFEWTERIGVHHVYEVLEALYEDTKDERYKICPLLKKEYMRSEIGSFNPEI